MPDKEKEEDEASDRQCCPDFKETVLDDGRTVEMHTFGCAAIGRDENSHGRYV